MPGGGAEDRFFEWDQRGKPKFPRRATGIGHVTKRWDAGGSFAGEREDVYKRQILDRDAAERDLVGGGDLAEIGKPDAAGGVGAGEVSLEVTELDVYKRQRYNSAEETVKIPGKRGPVNPMDRFDAQGIAAFADLERAGKECDAGAKIAAYEVDPVSYTHLDVYKRQVIPLRDIGRAEARLVVKNDRPEVPIHRRLHAGHAAQGIRAFRLLHAVLDGHAPGIDADAVINRAPDGHADQRQGGVTQQLDAGHGLSGAPAGPRGPGSPRGFGRSGFRRLAIRLLGRRRFTSFGH